MTKNKKYNYVVDHIDGEYWTSASVRKSICGYNKDTYIIDSAIGLCTLIAVRTEVDLNELQTHVYTLVSEDVYQSCVRGFAHTEWEV